MEVLIDDFRDKIEAFFAFLQEPKNGQRLMAKIKDRSGAHNDERIFEDFTKVYKRYIRRHRNELSEFFKRESAAILRQLLDMFEGEVVGPK